jgi:hypothetical protein
VLIASAFCMSEGYYLPINLAYSITDLQFVVPVGSLWI